MSRRLPPCHFRRALQAGLPVERRAPETKVDDAIGEVWWFAYDASGRLAFQGVRPASADHGLTWTALEPFIDIDLQYNRASHVDGSVGRWLAEDPALFSNETAPVGYHGDDPNLYPYVGNATSDPDAAPEFPSRPPENGFSV